MFISTITGIVTDLTPNNQTRFQCTVTLNIPLDEIANIEPGRLIATENIFSTTKEKRYTVLQIIDTFPAPPEGKAKKTTLTMVCTATPIGQDLVNLGARKGNEIVQADTFPAYGGVVEVLDDDMTRTIIHHIAPDSLVSENGARIDIGTYRSNPNVNVGMDASSLLRGNGAVISARPRARTTMTYNLIAALLQQMEQHVHIVYLDVNNTGTLSLAPLLSKHEHASVLALNDKFVPASIFTAMRNIPDRAMHKRAVLDFLDMMILPSVLEERRHDFSYAISAWMRANKVAIYRPNEQTVDQFINDIRVDVLDGAEEEAEEYINELMNSIAETYRGERFGEKNTKDLLDMVEEFSRDARSQSARKTLYDLKSEITSVFETYSKDIPTAARKSIQDIVNQLNDDTRSSLLVVQGQKTTDILRFVGTLAQTLVEERIKRLKIRTPVLFIFNNVDDYVGKNGNGAREGGSDRFTDSIQLLQTNGRRHGLGFCLTFESAFALDHSLARRIQSYFIGPITFVEEPGRIADLLNVSEDLVRPAVRYEDGDFLFTSSDSPYHRRVPLPVCTPKNTTVMHGFLDTVRDEQERRKAEYLAQEEERKKRFEEERTRRREEPPVEQSAPVERSAPNEPQPQTQRPEPRQPDSRQPDNDRRRGGRDQRDSGRQRNQRQEPRQEPRPEPRQEPRPEPRREPRPEPRREPRPEPRREPRPEPRQEARREPRPDPRPQAVLPVDEFFDAHVTDSAMEPEHGSDAPAHTAAGETADQQAARRGSRGRRGGRGRGKPRKDGPEEGAQEQPRSLTYEEFIPSPPPQRSVPPREAVPPPHEAPPAPREAQSAPAKPAPEVARKPEPQVSGEAAEKKSASKDGDKAKAPKRPPRRRSGPKPKGPSAPDAGKDA